MTGPSDMGRQLSPSGDARGTRPYRPDCDLFLTAKAL